MPYSMSNPPSKIDALPDHAKEIWIAAFNSAMEQGNSEESCNKIAWNAVEEKYEQDADGKWVAKKSLDVNDVLVTYGDAVKALGSGKVSGYLIRFGTPAAPDLEGEYFDAATDFGDAVSSDNYYNHGLDVKLAKRVIGKGQLKKDEVGIWIDSQLNLRDEYERAVYALAEKGKLGWSSGTAAHLVEREEKGKATHITRWPLGLDASLTPTPAEPRNVVIPIKSLKATDLQAEPEVAPEGAAAQATVPGQETKAADSKQESKQMEEKKEEPKAPTVEERLAALEKENADLKAVVNAPAESLAGKKVNIKKVTDLGFKDDATKSFMHWIRTGDDVPYKAAMQGQTDAEGGYVVPDDFYNKVIEKRNEVAIMRTAGAQVVPTSLDKLLVPAENTAATKFVVTAEEAAYDENEPTLDQPAIDVYKFTKLIKLSEELEADAKANLEGWLSSIWGRTMGLAENYYMCNVAAAGTAMPTSVTYSATTTTAVASQTVFTAAELLTVIYAVPSGYSDNLVMLMRRSTLGGLRALTGNPFAFAPTPMAGSVTPGTRAGYAGTVHDIPCYLTDDLPAQAAANKPVVVFNPTFYMIADREGLVVSRNPWLYQANGQIGLFAKFRFGAELLIADSARVMVSKT